MPIAKSVPAEPLRHYRALVASRPGVDLKGATMPYTSVNGNMFSYLQANGRLAIRLPAAQREAFFARFGAAPVVMANGAAQKEYVDVPEDLLPKTSVLAPVFAASHEYASALRSKPTKRKPPSGKIR